MAEDTQRWHVGDVRITSVVEAQTDGIPPAFMFPDATEAMVAGTGRLAGTGAAGTAGTAGAISMRVQALVVEAGGRTVVVDPCVGNGKQREQPWWSDQRWPFLDRFRAAGFDPEAVDLVVHTHLHADHVGWDTRLVDGTWVPTFPRARHVYARAELDRFRAGDDPEDARIDADSVAPVFAAGLADVVDTDADLGDGLRLVPTPGHTPGHAALWVDSAGKRAVLAGDAIHHPFQCTETDVAFVADADPAAAATTRRALLGELAGSDTLLLPAHFPDAAAGHVRRDGSAWRFTPVAARDRVPA